MSASGYSLPANTISVTVNAPTTTTLSSSANPSVVGQTVSYTATVSVTSPDTGIPTGNVEFFDNGVAISACGGTSGVVVNGSGQAVCALSWPSIVGQSITAGYVGNLPAYYLPSASTVLSQVVHQASTTTAVTSSANPSVVGQTVTYTATVSVTSPGSGSPTGNIEFFDNGTAISTCGGTSGVTVNGADQATCLVAWPSTVGQTITAKYLGDSNYLASPTSPSLNQVVNKASPTLSVTAPGTGVEGTAITAANITATLANSSGASDVNTITFTVFGPQTTAPTTCTTGGTAAGTATPAGNGTYATSSSFTPSAVGTYWWYASSPSDANNNAAASTCGAGMTSTVVGKASPTLSVTAPATGTAGTTIAAASITSTLASSSGTNDANTITFTVFGPQTTAPTTCTTGGTAAGTATPAGNGTYATNTSFTPSGAGTYWWYASSASDTNNNAAASACGTGMTSTVVAKASPTLSVTAPGTGTAGTAIPAASITSTLASSSGTNDANVITFKVFGPQTTAPTTCTTGGTLAGTATPAGNGTYATNSSFTPSGAGTYWWYASSPSDTNNNGAASACGTGMTSTVVAKASPTLSVTAPGTGTAGTAIPAASITSTLASSSGTSDTNTITFTVFGPQATAPTTCTTGGTAAGTATPAGNGTYADSSAFTPSGAGTYWWYASSASDTNNNGAASTCGTGMTSTVVAKASPTLGVTAPGAGTVGTAIPAASITSTLASSSGTSDTNTITFTVFGPQATAPTTCTTGGTAAGTATPAGNGTYATNSSFTPSAVGTYWWYASSASDTNNNGAASTCGTGMTSTVVGKTSPTIATTLSAASITVGGTAFDSSTLTGETSNAGGSVTYSYYTNNTCSTGLVTVGSVTVTNGSVPVSATATFSTAGTYYWQAVYNGDTNNNTASSPCTAVTNEQLTVNKTSPTIATTLSAASITVGGTAFDSSTLTGETSNAGGSVTYSYYTNNTCSTGLVTVGSVTVTNGSVPVSATATFSTAGTYYWQAVYNGDTNNNTASSPCTAVTNEQLTVNKTSPTIATTLSSGSITVGGIALDSATLTGETGNAGGTVTYNYYTNNTCSTGHVTVGSVTVSGGVVPSSSNVTFSTAGTYYWQAVYNGDTNNNTASSPCTAVTNEQLTVNKTSPTIATTLSAASITVGGTAHDSSTLTGETSNAGGSVTYSYYTNNTCSTGLVTVGSVTVTNGSVPVSATATFSTAGTYYWQAVYNGDTNNNTASSPCTAVTNEKLTVNNTVTKSTAGTYTLTVPAYVTSFTFTMSAGGGGGGVAGASGGGGGTVTGTITIPSSSSATTFTVIVGGGGGGGATNTGGAGGASGTGCALGGVGGGGTDAGGGGGGATCIYLQGAPSGTVIAVGGGGGGGGAGSGTGGKGDGGLTTNPGTSVGTSGTNSGGNGGTYGTTQTTGTPQYTITNTAGKLGGTGTAAGTCTAGVCGAGGAGTTGGGTSSVGGGGGGGGVASGGGGTDAGTGANDKGGGGGGGSAYTGGTATITVVATSATDGGGGAGGAASSAGTAGSVSFTGAGLTLA